MTDDTDKILVLKKKAELYHSEKVPVHITFKRKIPKANGQQENIWENGYITECPSADFFKLEYLEQGKIIHGRNGDFVFFMEIEEIEEFSEVKR